MAVTLDQPAPYAPASAILELIDRHRSRGLPPIVDADVLLRAGISDSLVPRTLQALKVLDLLTDEGRPSEIFEGLRLAATAEYQQRLADWLNAAYADALAYVDPAIADEIAIRDAFRKYVPTGQQSRMVTLFMGLFTAAGVMAPRQKTAKSSATKNAPTVNVRLHPGKGRSSAIVLGSAHKQTVARQPASGIFPAALTGLLASLPGDGNGWTQEQRDKFMMAFPVILDFCYPIMADLEPKAGANRLLNENGD